MCHVVRQYGVGGGGVWTVEQTSRAMTPASVWFTTVRQKKAPRTSLHVQRVALERLTYLQLRAMHALKKSLSN